MTVPPRPAVPAKRPPSRPAASRPQVRPSDNSPPDPIIQALQSVADAPDTNANARTAALRTIAEMQGRLGKHQAAPGAGLAQAPLSDASRPQLEAELQRLRLHFAALAKA